MRPTIQPARRHGLPSTALVVMMLASVAAGWANPVYIDDTPRGWELFRLAQEQVTDNTGEAVRLFQELLDDYGSKLLPVQERSDDHFVSVRARVLTMLRSSPRLLDRYRAIESAEADRLLAANALERLARTRPATTAGLEAILRLAQRDIESARFEAALAWLGEAQGHRDLDDTRFAHHQFMSGIASRALEEIDDARAALRALRSMGEVAAPLRVRLESFVRQTTLPRDPRGLTLLEVGPPAELEGLVAEPIWSIALDEAPLDRSLPDLPENSGSRRSKRRSGELLTATATATAEAIFISEGHRVRAIDRFTGRDLWRPWSGGTVVEKSQMIADLNVVAVAEDALVTITGHAYSTAGTSDRRVVCLDPRTGRLRWSVRIDQLSGANNLDELIPHDTPIIAEGRVYVLARKVTKQLLTSCYVICLGLDDGQLHWSQHVASSGGIRAKLARPYSSLIFHRGDLVVATAIGAIARLRADTGQTMWLRRYHPPLNPFLPDERRPWEISSAVVTPAGVIALRPDLRAIVRLDWASGDEVEMIPSEGRDGWNAPFYLLADDMLVYAVGIDVRAFSLESLRRPLWTFPPRARGGRNATSEQRVELRGRVQTVSEGLIVPTSDGIHLLHAANGLPQQTLPSKRASNPLAVGPQLIVATSDELAAYMPFDRAEQMLRQQIADATGNPGPSLALMRLGMQIRDLRLALDVSELVIETLEKTPEAARRRARQELFDILLELDRQRLATTIEQGEELHAVIGLVAQEAPQRVEHLLAKGDWLAGHARSRAVEAYQTILSDPVLAGTPRVQEGSIQSGAAWAIERLAGSIRKYGPKIYQPQGELAAARLRRLNESPTSDPATYVGLAREFPFAEAAIDAALIAAERYGQADRHREAVGALAAVFRLAQRGDRAERLLGWLVDRAVEQGWNGYARGVLDDASRRFGNRVLAGRSGARAIDVRLTEVPGSPPPRPPRFGDIVGNANKLRGVVVTSSKMAGATMPPDRVLLRDGDTIRLHGGPALEEAWSVRMPVLGATSVVSFDEHDILLWIVPPGKHPRAVMLDARTGQVRWTASAGDPEGGEPQRFAPDGQRFNPSQTVARVDAERVYVIERTGGVFARRRKDGRTPVWDRRHAPPLVQVSASLITDFALVLTGLRRPPERPEPVPAMVVLDPRTGRTTFALRPLGGAEVRWMVLEPLGGLIYGTAAGIEKIDLLSGESLWSTVAAAAKRTQRSWLVGDYVVVEGPAARPSGGPTALHSLRLADGFISAAFDRPAGGDWQRDELRDLIVDGERIFAQYTQRIVRYHPTGAVLGADRNSLVHDYRWVFAFGERLCVVSRFKREPGPSGRRQRFVYQLYGMSANCKLVGTSSELDPLPIHLQRARMVDGWLLLSTPSETLTIPMRLEGGE